jgi:hypothetical protein
MACYFCFFVSGKVIAKLIGVSVLKGLAETLIATSRPGSLNQIENYWIVKLKSEQLNWRRSNVSRHNFIPADCSWTSSTSLISKVS